jgi:hypothetical protein
VTCYLLPEPRFLFISDIAPDLLYYSHIPAIFLSLLIAVFVLFSAPRAAANRLLFIISVLFSLWAFINLFVWTNTSSDVVGFLWSLFGMLYALISIAAIYFVYAFINGRMPPAWYHAVLLALFMPVALASATIYNLTGLNLEECSAGGMENLWFTGYYTALAGVSAVWIAVLTGRAYSFNKTRRIPILLMG